MEIKIQSVHFKANDILATYIQDKVSKLAHLNERILSSDVCLKLDKSDKAENKVCEIKLSVPGPGKGLFAKRQCKTFEEATNETVDALQQQLKKRKTQTHKGRKV